MSVWDDVAGQPDVVTLLARFAREPDDLTHAWLFTGPPGSGRSTAARAFAAALQCADAGCGQCHDCRTALAGTHADVTLVATEHVFLRLDDVRPLILLAHQRPTRGRWRVIVVEDADRLNDASGNALLKVIEEPPERTIWLLCAPGPDDVLTTIRSRCRRVGLRTPPVEAVTDLLVRQGADPAVAAYAARAAQSHIGMARRLARDEASRNRRREVLRLPEQTGTVGAAVISAGHLVEVATEEAKAATADRDATERAALLRSLGAEAGTRTLPPAVRAQVRQLEENQKRRATRAQRDVLDRALVDLLSLYRDALVAQFGAGVDLVNAQARGDVERLARALTPEGTLRRMEAIGLARERIEANVAPLLAIEALMVTLRIPT